MPKRILFFSMSMIIVFCSFSIVYGQTIQVSSVVHTQYKINSQIIGGQRTILVRVPANYASDSEKFPVIYILDTRALQNA